MRSYRWFQVILVVFVFAFPAAYLSNSSTEGLPRKVRPLAAVARALDPTAGPASASLTPWVYLPVLSPNSAASTHCVELFVNGGFENDDGWVLTASRGRAQYTDHAVHSGGRSLQLGLLPGDSPQTSGRAPGQDSHPARAPEETAVSDARQMILIPQSSSATTLSFWYDMGSEYTGGLEAVSMLILDPRTSQLLEVLPLQSEGGGIWKPATMELSEYRGRWITIAVRVVDDSTGTGGRTWIFLDDMSARACSVDPTPTPTPSSTASRTLTATPSPSQTVTATGTPTLPEPTPSATPTPTSSPTSFSTFTPTVAPSPTGTASTTPDAPPSTATSTAEPGPDDTPTPTPSGTTTAEPSPTGTTTQTSTPTGTPTSTPLPTLTATSTYTPTPTATSTNTFTPTPAATSTGIFTPTPTTTPTGTFTASPAPTPTSTFTPTPVPTPTATATPRNCTELAVNGGFEANRSWVFSVVGTNAGYTGTVSHSGSRSLQLGLASAQRPVAGPFLDGGRWSFGSVMTGQAATVASIAYQRISVPAAASDVALGFWYSPGAANPGSSDAQVFLVLSGDGGTVLRELARLQPPEDDRVWKWRAFDLTQYRGQSIAVAFKVTNASPALAATWMYVDDVTVAACPAGMPSQ